MPPVPPEVLVSPPVLELAEPPGELGELLDEEDEPPGTTTVSFSFVVVVLEEEEPPVAPGPPPGTTVVVSLRSQAPRANALNRINRYPLRFISTLLSSWKFAANCNTGHSNGHAAASARFIRSACELGSGLEPLQR